MTRTTSWQALEDRVRQIATMIWRVPCAPREVAGVQLDGVLELRPNHWILLEITENTSLQKLREDLTKFDTVVPTLFARRIFTECFFVTRDEPPESIPKSAAERHVVACSMSTFANRFFDFPAYHLARAQKSFGSSFNPFTGDPDRLAYIPVSYSATDSAKEYDIQAIARSIRQGAHVVLTGEYGTGKSRCVREVFGILASTHSIRDAVPLAIDLRKTWGLLSADEIVSRHFSDLGLSAQRDRAIANLDNSAFVFLLDGFDELGSQGWSGDAQELRRLRRGALEGVRDLVRRSRGGVLITGRKGYFNNQKEMLESLGLDGSESIRLECYEDFSPDQVGSFLDATMPGVQLPYWLPRRPLICQVIFEMDPDHRAQIFAENSAGAGFWDQFIAMITTRESWIRQAMNPESVRGILHGLARKTRFLVGDYGPLSPEDIFGEFRRVLGQEPSAESAQILSRLPGLGLMQADSADRQFVDRFLLDGLRGDDVRAVVEGKDYASCSHKWLNPLGDFGQMVASKAAAGAGKKPYIAMASRAARDGNSVLSLDLVGSVLRSATDDETVDFGGLVVRRGRMSICDLGAVKVSALSLRDCEIGGLLVDNETQTGVELEECLIGAVFGVTNAQGLPPWCKHCVVEAYQSVATTSRIRGSHIDIQHQILCVIIRKTFFQKGSGRKEQALLRGLGQLDRGGFRHKILRLLTRENILYSHQGDDGLVYHPVHSETARMGKMLAELNHSRDPVWVAVGEL